MQDVMQGIDPSTVAGIAAAAYVLVGTLKSAWPNWASGKEELLSLIGSIVIGGVMKRWGDAFATVPWGNHIIQCMIAGMFAQLIHDKLMNPALRQIRNSATKTPPQA